MGGGGREKERDRKRERERASIHVLGAPHEITGLGDCSLPPPILVFLVQTADFGVVDEMLEVTRQ